MKVKSEVEAVNEKKKDFPKKVRIKCTDSLNSGAKMQMLPILQICSLQSALSFN